MEVKKDIKNIFSDYSILLINKYFLIILLITSSILLTRILGKTGYGQFNLFALVANIAFISLINWTSTSVLRFGKEEYIKEGKLNKVFWARNFIVLGGIIFAIAGFFIFKEKLDGYTQVKSVYKFIIAFLIFRTFLDYLSYVFQATRRLKVYSFIEILSKFFFVVSLLILLIIDKKEINYVLFIYIISQFLTLLILIKWIDFKWFLPVTLDRTLFKEMLSFSYPLIFSALSAYIVNYIDLIFIKKYFLISDVGVYSLSYNIMTYSQQIIMVVITVTGPILIVLYTEKKENIIKDYLSRLMPQGIFLWSIFLVFSIIILPYIIPFIFGEEFKNSILPMQILLCGLAYNGISCFYSGVLTTYKLIKKAVIVNIGMAILNLIGDMILVPLIGIKGAAISSAIIFSLGGIAYMYIGNKRLDIKEYKSLVFLIPVLFTLSTAFYKVNIIFLLLGIGFIYYFILRKFRLFKESDTRLLDYIAMPLFLRKFLYNVYRFLSSTCQ